MVEVVMAIVTNNNKEVLIVCKAKSEGKLLWQFPGGTVEQNESIEEATIRELKEETGINGKVVKILGSRIHPYTKKHIAYVLCEYIGGEISISDPEIDQVQWAKINKLDQYFTTPIFEPVQEYLNSLL